MKVFVKESLYVLDYENNIVDCIFNSDDHRTPGYAYNINIEDSNTGYSNLTFTMPTKIIPMPTAMGHAKDAQEAVLNPKLALLTPLVKIRYERQIVYTGEEPVTVSIPVGYGDTTVYQEITYNPGDLIEYDHDGNQGTYVMDYIVQPTDKKRSGLEVSITFTAIDYPRFNLSKKKLGLTINDNTITRGDWSIYEKEPMNIPGAIQYIKWTQTLSDDVFGPNANIPLDWDPSIMSGYPLTEEQIGILLKKTEVWTYGITATIFYWPISQSGRFEGVLYNRDDYLTLNLYEKNLVEVLGEGAKLDGNKNYTLMKYTWVVDDDGSRYVKTADISDHEYIIYELNEVGTEQYLGSVLDNETPPHASTNGDWYIAKTPIGTSLDFYGYTWGYYDQGQAYLTPNNPCNYLNWILENTNWKIKTRTDKTYRGVYFTENDFPANGNENDYLLLRGPKPDEIQDEWERPVYRGQAATVEDLPDGNNVDNWAIVSNGITSVMYRWNGTEWYLSRDGVSKIYTKYYVWNGNAWEETSDMWTASIDKETGVLYDVDQVETEVAKPDGSTGNLFETTQLRSTLTASDSNCYNAITELAKSFQLYPVFDCVCREIALHIFCGKNYGLTYKLGKSLENTTVKEDGDKVITKLRCYGGSDAQGSENINLGDANRQFIPILNGYYTTNELPTSNVIGFVAVVDPDLDEDEPWVSGPNRQVYFFEGNGWVLGIDNGDGTWAHGDYTIDAQSGTIAPWDPNDQMYIQARSPYGTEYIYNFKWMYDNGWMSKEDILGLYKKSLEIQELNKGFLDTYAKDYKYAYEMSVKAGVDYKTNQDEYLACFNAMQDSYYNNPISPSEGQFTAFYQAPHDARPGNPSLGLQENPDYYYIDMYHCYSCGYTKHEAFPTKGSGYECPNCRSTADCRHLSIRTPIHADFTETTSKVDNPKTKGFYREVINDVGNSNAQYINVATPIPTAGFEEIGNQQKFRLGSNEVYDKSSHMYNWNDYVAKWQEYYGLQLDNLVLMNKYIKICDDLEEAYNIYLKQLSDLEDYIQDNWGDYIVEGKYADNTICYTNILLAKSLEASDEYCIPKVTYNASVVDSSGLIEYRMPLAETYNDLVKTLHNNGQIVPHAGDYVKLIDEQLGLYGTPAVITSIKRNLDNPQSNTITVDTSYTDDEEFVGNIITATNTVLNNQDIYARTAILKADGTIEGGSLNKSLEQNNGDNIAFVGAKGSSLLDSTGLVVTNQGDARRKMRYAGNGVFGTSDNGSTWQSMMTPEGINANYINAGSIDTKHIQIMSGQHAKVTIDNLGLAVKTTATSPYHLPTTTVTYGSTTVPNWDESGVNLSAFIGVDRENNAKLYVKGQLVADGGSKIGNWIVGEKDLYDTTQSVYLSPDGITATVGGISRSNLTLKAGSNFGVTKEGHLYSSSGSIGGWNINADTLESANSGAKTILRSNLPTDSSKAIEVNNGKFYVQRDGKMVSTYANIGGWDIDANQLRKSVSGGGKNYSIELRSDRGYNDPALLVYNSTDSQYNFYVKGNGDLYSRNADISGTISASTISGSSISGGSISSTSISGSTISGSLFRTNYGRIPTHGTDVDINLYRTEFGNDGLFRYYNNTGFICCGSSYTTHPYVSALNVASQLSSVSRTGSNSSLSFRNVSYMGSGGDQIGFISYGTNGSGIYYASNNMELNAGGYLSISSKGTSAPAGTNDGSIYITADAHISLHAGSGKHIYAGADGWNGGANARVTTDKGDVSSRNTKTNIKAMSNAMYDDALDLLRNMKLYTYDYKYDLYDNPHQYGFILDEIEKQDTKHHFFDISSHKAWTRGRRIDYCMEDIPEDRTGIEVLDIQHYNADTFTKYLLTCIKGLQNKIDELEKKIKKEND